MSKRLFTAFLLAAFQTVAVCGATVEEITEWVGDGHWQQARAAIDQELARPNVDFKTREALKFQQDLMMRIRRDFFKTREEAVADARKIVPAITDEQIAAWEKAGALEAVNVDGANWYFSKAGANMFRINPEAKALKEKLRPATNDLYRLRDVRAVIADCDRNGGALHLPHTWRVTYSLSVKPDMVPAGEAIRAWLPYPHAADRQKNIRLVSTEPQQCVLSTNTGLASVYLEKPSAGHARTEFKVVFEVTTEAFYEPIDPARVQPADGNGPALRPFTGEAPPQIIFPDKIRALSREIVGGETNPYWKARKIFEWVNKHVVWTTAREYSTIECLPEYALAGGHGDCGIKSMTFMTLCRLNGIPARWESGWTTEPSEDMHDWCEIYLAPYGWVPVDVTYGLVDSQDERERWFYFGGIDAMRFFCNTDYDQPVYPAKTFFRSEIVDFQRGEVEWRGGNLYFNQWNYDFKAEHLKGL